MSNRAWVTLATNDSYGLGALVLAHSLRRSGSSYPAVVLITPSVTQAMRDRLSAVFAEVVTVDVLDSRDAAHLALLQRPELGITFTKIHCWNLTQYEKCVFLDADALVVQNCDELFEREELSAAPDVGWPDCFNSGVFVFIPSADTFDKLIKFAQERGSFDGGDQGLLNAFFSDWARGDINKHLPFLYNVTSAAFYSYIPALKHYGQDLKIIHFIGAAKPWLQHFNWESRTVDAPDHLRQFLQLWWDLFVADVHTQLDVSMIEVEATQPEPSTEQPPEMPPQDVSQHLHYQPILDPESEFPWHRPDAHIQKEIAEEQIDMSKIFDPWDIYGGQIPPKSNDVLSYETAEMADRQKSMREYVWEYTGLQHKLDNEAHQRFDFQYEHRHIEANQHIDVQVEDRHTNKNQYYGIQLEHGQIDSHKDSLESPHNYGHDNQYHTERDFQFEQQHAHIYQAEHNEFPHTPPEYLSEQNHCHQQVLCSTHTQQNNNSQHLSGNEHLGYTLHWPSIDHNHIRNTCSDHCQEQIFYNNCQTEIHTNVNDLYNGFYNDSNAQNTYSQKVDPGYNTNDYVQQDREHIYKENNYNINNFDSHISPSVKQQDVEVHHVCEEHKRNNKIRQPKTKKADMPDNEKSNGNVSESDSELEDILPRHPYDGFYLRHRSTIDSRGRKICTHEIPLLQPPLAEPVEVQDNFSTEDTIVTDCQDQSGVAGNLARVALDSSQREAIDDLTRRQGWEAGNIDYMGVDSFDNIWAKISQTLSQVRPSPPKQSPPKQSPPKELAQPQTSPEEIQTPAGEVSQEPILEPVEMKVVTSVDKPIPVQEPAKPTSLEQLDLIIQPESTETSISATEVTKVEATAQSEITAILEVAAPVETPLSNIETQSTPEVPEAAVKPTVTGDSEIPVTVQPQIISEEKAETVSSETIEPAIVLTGASALVTEKESVIASVPLPSTEQVVEPVTATKLVPDSAPVQTTALVVAGDLVTDTKPATATESETVTVPTTAIEPAKTIESPPPTAIVESPAVPEIPVEKLATEEPTSIPDAAIPLEAPITATESVSTEAIPIAPATVASPTVTEVPASEIPVPVEAIAPVVVPSSKIAPKSETTAEVIDRAETAASDVAPVKLAIETPKIDDLVQAAPDLSAVDTEVPPYPIESTPEKVPAAANSSSDSPPLAHTPSKEEILDISTSKSAERRKPAGKLQLSPPLAPDLLPTPDSELEDAAALAQSIIASELHTPTVTSPATSTPASPPAPLQHSRLSVDEPEVPTPPVGAVSLSQIGVKAKGKTTTAAQIESSVTEKTEPAAACAKPEAATAAPVAESTAAAPLAESTTAKSETAAPKVVQKKKVLLKKVPKKTSAPSGEAPVPPPRKEKKPKE